MVALALPRLVALTLVVCTGTAHPALAAPAGRGEALLPATPAEHTGLRFGVLGTAMLIPGRAIFSSILLWPELALYFHPTQRLSLDITASWGLPMTAGATGGLTFYTAGDEAGRSLFAGLHAGTSFPMWPPDGVATRFYPVGKIAVGHEVRRGNGALRLELGVLVHQEAVLYFNEEWDDYSVHHWYWTGTPTLKVGYVW